MSRGLGAHAAVLVLLSACTSLPEIDPSACGNAVVEGNEDCDLFAPEQGQSCRAPGSVGECRLDCRAGPGGRRWECPGGWGCDGEGICRRPSSEFDALSVDVGGVQSLRPGDFDGDGRTDLLASEPPDSIGLTRFRLLYFDANAALEEERPFPRRVVAPSVRDISGDGKSDLLFSIGGVVTILGSADRSLVPETFLSYRVRNSTARLLGIHNRLIQNDAGLLVAADIKGVGGFYTIRATEDDSLVLIAEAPFPLAALVGDPVAGNVIEDTLTSPCQELVFAAQGASSFWLMDSCTRDPMSRELAWRERVLLANIPLEPAGPIDRAPLLADVNGDGHLDVLIGVDGGAYVSYGDGAALAPAEPYQLAFAEQGMDLSLEIAMPIAAGDFSADGIVDFVFPRGILISKPSLVSSLPTYGNDYRTQGEAWTSALIADLNGNGKLDVVAASRDGLSIDFFNGTGSEFLVPYNLPTTGPVDGLAVSDFDGDLIRDLAFIQRANTEDEPDTLMFAFGASAGPPLPVAAARVPHVNAISIYEEGSVGNLIVASSEASGSGVDTILTLLETVGGRVPLAPYTLSTFLSTGSTNAATALEVSVGRFSSKRADDLITLAVVDTPLSTDVSFWFGPAIRSSASVPVRLQDVSEPLAPIDFMTLNTTVTVTSGTGDLDGDGLDESIWAMPAVDDGGGAGGCGLVILRMPRGSATPAASPPLLIDEPCSKPELLARDVDADGATDLVLLTGAAGLAPGKLWVLWNDGRGGFSRERTLASAREDDPRSFTSLAGTAQRPFALVYTTPDRVMLASTAAAPREFELPQPLADVVRATSITGADVNGDGVLDLAVADAGGIKLLKAGLIVR